VKSAAKLETPTSHCSVPKRTFFSFRGARNGRVDSDGSYGFATEFAETATETAQSAPSGVTTSSGDEPGRTFFSNGRSGHTRRVLSGLPKERILLNSRRSLNQRASPRFRAVSVAVSVKIRGKARNSILNHRTVPTGEIRLIETAQRASNTTFPSKIVITHFASLIASVGTE